jgi:molecular chaperone HtpG
MGQHLGSRVRAVHVSRRLTVSPVCLASDECDWSPHVEKLFAGTASRPRTLELNASHPVIRLLSQRLEANVADPLIPAATDVLFGLASLAEGSELADPSGFSAHVTELLSGSLGRDA